MTNQSNLLKLAAVSLLLAILAVGCSDRTLVEPQMPTSPGISQFGLPAVTLDSAIFSIYIGGVLSTQTVNVHRITANWADNTVTFNNFGGAYDPAVVGSYLTDGLGWRSVDVTPLVQGWIDGTYPNYGLLIEQGSSLGSAYPSSEYINVAVRPMLKICWTSGGIPECETIQMGINGIVKDAYVSQLYPNDNYGSLDRLFTGFVNGTMKYSLLRFDLPSFPETAAIGDFVWYDDNQDGIQDLSELGVQGVTVHLMDCNGNILATDVTDVSGYYLFSSLTPGDYNIEFVLPGGYQFSPQDQGSDDALDSDADVNTGLAICTHLDGGETDLTWDAGIFVPNPPSGCTRTIGYWKTHAGFGPQADVVTPLLPIWLGTAGGAQSIHVTTAAIAVDILSQDVYGVPSNGITKLYAQLLGAKLNGANGADLSAVAATIAAADTFLATHYFTSWSTLTKAQKQTVNQWKGNLDDYNNGLIGPEHCN